MAVNGYDIAKEAQNYLGTPYVWGGNSLTGGIDCSGLVQQIYRKFGISVPRVTYDQIRVGKQVAYEELQAGDMVFFDTDRSIAGPDHVGIYLGDGLFIHAPRPGSSVKIDNMASSYYSSRYMGGRRHGGIVGGGQYNPNSSAGGEGAAVLTDEELAASYGFAYSYLNHNPELKGIFKQAVAETWQAPKFMAAVRETTWWKENSEAMRRAQMLEFTDPGTFNARILAAQAKIRDVANQLGALVTDKVVAEVAEQAVRTELSDNQIADILSGYVDFNEQGTLGGIAGMAEMRIRELARQNGVQLTDESVKKYAQNIIAGNVTIEQWEGFIRQQAASLFPAYKEQIEAGINAQDLASPYMQTAARELELSLPDLGTEDEIIRKGMNQVNQDGVPAGMSLTDYENMLRSDPRWMQTNNAREKLMGAGAEVLRNMGLIGG